MAFSTASLILIGGRSIDQSIAYLNRVNNAAFAFFKVGYFVLSQRGHYDAWAEQVGLDLCPEIVGTDLLEEIGFGSCLSYSHSFGLDRSFLRQGSAIFTRKKMSYRHAGNQNYNVRLGRVFNLRTSLRR